MKKYFKRRFALTDQGAKDLIKSSASSFLVYVVNMFPAMLLMIFMDELILGHVKSKGLYLGISLGILVLMYIILSVEYDFLYNATYKESENLRIHIAETLSRLPLSYFSKNDLSDIAQTIMSDVEAIEHAMSHAMAKVVGFAVFFPLISVVLLLGNVQLALSVILPVVVTFVLSVVSKKIQVRENLKYYKKLRDNSESFQEAIEHQQDIKSFGMVEKIRKSLYTKMEESEKIHIRVEIAGFIPVALSGIVMFLSLAIVLFVGTLLYSRGEIGVLYFLGYLLAAIKIKDAVEGVSMNTAELFFLDERFNRIKEMGNTVLQEGDDTQIQDFDIVLKDVSFSYDGEQQVLHNISFAAKQNQVTALVGMSGCGKTSILRLISRLYDYDKGSITIGGKDIKRVSTKSLFENVSIVFQDVTLFNTSVMDNIRIGRKDATDGEVMEAARFANCEEFVLNLPEGYATFIGENGATLSGGERQRLSIARAFLKDSPIIILDEIAASLDVENEKKIQESLNKLTKNKTVIIISHRLKSVENADKIVVIEEGRVDAWGTHEELINSSNVYTSLLGKAKLADEFKY